MAHELFGERFFGRRIPGWHKLGKVFPADRQITPSEAVEEANLDFSIEMKPLLLDLGGVQSAYGRNAIVREPTADDFEYRVFGEVDPGYTILQNREIAAMVDPLSEKWPLETIGALNLGATMFLTLDAGEADIKGDPIRQFFLIDDTRDGKSALSIAFTPVRVVCQNTLTAGKASAVASASLRHFEGMAEELEWRVSLLSQMQNVQEKVISSFEAIAELVLSKSAVNRVLERTYSYPRKPKKVALLENLSEEDIERAGGLIETARMADLNYSSAIARADERREIVRQLFGTFGEENPKFAGTGWALYNAVVEFEDFREQQKTEDPDISLLFGERARTKNLAYAAVVAER